MAAAASPAPGCDVVVPVWNRVELTQRCLESLRGQTVRHDVIVVDNGSSDDTPTVIRRSFADVHVVELGANRGFSAACNRGVREGTRDILVLLNNDVQCRPDFLERLIRPLSEDESVGSVAPLLLRPAEERIDSFGLTVDTTLAGFPRLRGVPLAQAQATKPRLIGPTGAAGAYRRRAWEEVGGLDERVMAYGEDVDLALRLRAAGWAPAAAPEALAVHLGSATSGLRSPWQRYQSGFSRGYFLRRYGVLRGPTAARALATEVLAAAGDAVVYSHDLAALHGRVAGWRSAAGRPTHPRPPRDAIDERITFAESLRLRRDAYKCA